MVLTTNGNTLRVCTRASQILNCDYISVYCLAINAKIVTSTYDHKVLEENISELLLGVKLVLLMVLLEENLNCILIQSRKSHAIGSGSVYMYTEIGISWVDY